METGVAVGWPLGLGLDRTGWPLGFRLRLALTQEDLEWPKDLNLVQSPSFSSDNSSSLDTKSTKSFFQDKSVSLGKLMGMPRGLPDRADLYAPDSHQQLERPPRNSGVPTVLTAEAANAATMTARSPRQLPNARATRVLRSSPEPDRHKPDGHRNPLFELRGSRARNHHDQDHCSPSSTKKKRQVSLPSAAALPLINTSSSSPGRNLLAVLSCARASPREEAVDHEDGEAKSATINRFGMKPLDQQQESEREAQAHHRLDDKILEEIDFEGNSKHDDKCIAAASLTHLAMQLPVATSLSLQHRMPMDSPGRKLYDNITFEDDVDAHMERLKKQYGSSNIGQSSGHCRNSKELNPLFTCSPLEAQGENDGNYGIVAREMKTSCGKSGLIVNQVHNHRATSTGIGPGGGATTEGEAPTTIRSLIAYRENTQENACLQPSSNNVPNSTAASSRSVRVGSHKKEIQEIFNSDKAVRRVLRTSKLDQAHASNSFHSGRISSFDFEDRPDQEFSKNRAVSFFVGRMVCCLSTPTTSSHF